MRCEDNIVGLLSNKDCSVSPRQMAAAVAIAQECVASWVETVRCMIATDSKASVYRLHAEDHAWLAKAASLVGTVQPENDTIKRLDQITNAISTDAAAVASLNAARWIARRYEISKRLH